MPVKRMLDGLNASIEEMDRIRWVFAIIAVTAAVYWHLAWRTIDGVAYMISSVLAAFSLIVVFATWTWLDRRQGKSATIDLPITLDRELVYATLAIVVGGFVLWVLLLA